LPYEWMEYRNREVPGIASQLHKVKCRRVATGAFLDCNMSSEFGKFLPLPEERDSSAPPRRRYSNLTEEGGGAELPRTNYPSLSTATVCTRSWLRSHTSIIITKINPPNHPTIPTTVLPALFPHQIARARSRLQGTPASDYFSDHQPQFAEWLLLSER